MAWVRSPDGGWWHFAEPVGGLFAAQPEEVQRVLGAAEEAARGGLWVVGGVSYGAAPGLDSALDVHAGERGPYAFFGLFSRARPEVLPFVSEAGPLVADLVSLLPEDRYAAAMEQVRAAIERGDTYQVNLTFPLAGRALVDPETLFCALAPASGAAHAMYLDFGEWAVVSLSPELFFSRQATRLAMRPMKGTRRRGRFAAEDAAVAAELAASAKDRAENLMIVDMVRNDLGRVARPGSVEVTRLFEIERYPTVWQMTSTVEAESDAELVEIFAALFPCASVTGAPKASTMDLIASLEEHPRGLYCGALGWIAPGAGRASFSVAIRTALCDRRDSRLLYGVGSGVLWESKAAAEYAECLAKGQALLDPAQPFGLFETCLWRPSGGVRDLARHLARLAASAEYFGFEFDPARAERAIAAATAQLAEAPHRLRIGLAADGEISVRAGPFTADLGPWRVVLAERPVDSADRFLFHKTTRRRIYDEALASARARGADEAILWNERGELTEGTRTNLALKIDGHWWTPPITCGLLPGIRRAVLLERKQIAERVLTKEDLARANGLRLFNSLRGTVRCDPTVVPSGTYTE